MTTKAHVKAMVKPLLARRADVALVGRMLVFHPVRHILRGVYVDWLSWKNGFRPIWFAFPLFTPARSNVLAWSEWIYPPHGLRWSIDIPEIGATLNEVIERDVLPILQPIETIVDFERYARAHEANPLGVTWPETAVPLALAFGRLDAARDVCAKSVLRPDAGANDRTEPDKRLTRALQHACRLLAADDRAGLAAFLHDCEAETVRALKIEHLWQPSPFPMEE